MILFALSNCVDKLLICITYYRDDTEKMNVTLTSRLVRAAKYGLLGAAVLPPAVSLSWYLALASEQQRKCTSDILHALPNVVDGGVGRFSRSLVTGLRIGLDYRYNLWGLDDTQDEYQETMKKLHTRSAQRILDTCLDNGGLYIKFGQANTEHILHLV